MDERHPILLSKNLLPVSREVNGPHTLLGILSECQYLIAWFLYSA